MALTISDPIGFAVPFGDRWLTIREIAFDTSYPTGGEPLTYKQLGLAARPDVVIPLSRLGFSFEYDKANEKIKALCPGVVTTAAGAAALDDFPLSGVGATAASIALTAGNTTTRFGGQVEVANAANLATLTGVVVLTIGRQLS